MIISETEIELARSQLAEATRALAINPTWKPAQQRLKDCEVRLSKLKRMQLAEKWARVFSQIYIKDWCENFKENAGPNFVWKNFPNIAVKFARIHYKLEFPNCLEEEVNIVEKIVINLCEEFVKSKEHNI